jgi:hypothetical protein
MMQINLAMAHHEMIAEASEVSAFYDLTNYYRSRAFTTPLEPLEQRGGMQWRFLQRHSPSSEPTSKVKRIVVRKTAINTISVAWEGFGWTCHLEQGPPPRAIELSSTRMTMRYSQACCLVRAQVPSRNWTRFETRSEETGCENWRRNPSTFEIKAS